jgi:putative hemolysin
MLFVVFGAIFLVTALLTAAEMATFSARPERMRQVAQSGDERGRLVLVYQRSPVSFLAAGQVIATAAALAIGAIMQVQVVPLIAAYLAEKLPITLEQADPYASTIALVVFTILALILTNVVPKQIGFDHADKVAVFFARPFRLLIRATRPVAWIVTVASRAFEAAVNRKVRHGSRVTEADVLTLVAEGIRIGALDRRETQFVKSALSLSDKRVRDVMTPIGEVEAVDAAWPEQKTDGAVRASAHSYLPVYEQSLDRPIGVLRARTWLSGPGQDVRTILEPIALIDADSSAVALFDELAKTDTRMVAVTEGGRTVGLVTLNDAVALLAGDVRSLQDSA